MSANVTDPQITAAILRGDFIRGGHWWTLAVNQRAGSFIAVAALRLGITPNQLSLMNVAIGVLTGIAVLALHDSALYVAAAVAFLGWETAFSFDCADGQLARGSGRTSPAGARIDLMGDFLIQVSLLSSFLVFTLPEVEGDYLQALVLAAAGGWFVPVFWQALALELGMPARASGRRPFFVNAAGGLRDYGFHIPLLAVALLIDPVAIAAVIVGVGALHHLFIAFAYLRFLKAPAVTPAS